nr:hypothetical protein [Clostridia bacterium]
KLLASIAAVLCVGVSALAFTACDNHKHTYDEDFTSCGAEGHWHAPNCGHDVDGTDFEEHNYGGWVTDTEATEEQEGLRKRTCNDCGYVDEDVIPQSGHTYDTVFTSCGETGHWYAPTCGHDVDGIDFEEHNYGEWNLIREGTAEHTGLRTRTCDDCGYVDEEIIPMHYHNIPDVWYNNDNSHWQKTDCGDEHGGYSYEVNKGSHSYIIEETPATSTEEGYYKRYCEVCGYVWSEHVIPPLGAGSSISPFTAVEGLNEGEIDETAELNYVETHAHFWTYTATAAGVVTIEVNDRLNMFLTVSTESIQDTLDYDLGEGNAISIPAWDVNIGGQTYSCDIEVSEGTVIYLQVNFIDYEFETYDDLGPYSFTITFTAA